MTEHWALPDSRVTILRDLAHELERASNEQATCRRRSPILQRGRRSLALATVNLLVLPFGTALGIYALWVLLTNEGRKLFEPQPLSSPSPR